MPVTLTAPPGESDPTPTEGDFAQLVLEKLHAMEVTAVRLAGERDTALARARRAESDAAGLLRVNIELQRQLDAGEKTIAEQAAAADDAPRHARGRWRR